MKIDRGGGATEINDGGGGDRAMKGNERSRVGGHGADDRVLQD